MKHDHKGPPDYACEGCFREAWDGLSEEERKASRFWGRVLVGFSFALAFVVAFVLWRISKGGKG